VASPPKASILVISNLRHHRRDYLLSSLHHKLQANLVGYDSKYGGHMAKLMSKSEIIQKIAEQHPNNMTRKDVKDVIESLAKIGYKELKKTGAFFVPGFAKFVVIKKPATKERSGINPFTKEPTIFKARPARKIVRARPVKAAKDAVS
jgi:DNA-binding protein HU-beta